MSDGSGLINNNNSVYSSSSSASSMTNCLNQGLKGSSSSSSFSSSSVSSLAPTSKSVENGAQLTVLDSEDEKLLREWSLLSLRPDTGRH